MRKTLLAFTLLFFIFFFIPNSLAQTQITNCTIIDTPGEYVLVNDILDMNVSECIIIATSNVTLDCQNHLIDGVDFYIPPPNETMSFGIHSHGNNNIIIKNCRLSDWSHPLNIQFGENVTIQNVEAFSGVWIGPFFESSTNVHVENITVYDFNNTCLTFRNVSDSYINGSTIYECGSFGIEVNTGSKNSEILSAIVYKNGIGLRITDSYNIHVKSITAYNNTDRGVEVTDGANNTLESIETYYTTPENNGILIHSPNTTLRNIYNHDEYCSVIDGTSVNSVLEYSRCSNVVYGCWHIFANNTIVRHNNFPDGAGLFGTFYTEIYNNTFGPPSKPPRPPLEIRDWQGVAPSFNKIYNNTFNNSGIWNRWLDYQPNSNEIYNNSFYLGIVVDEGFNTSIHDNTFKGCTISIAFFNGATNSNAFLNYINDGASSNCTNATITNIFGNETIYLGELCSPYAFYFNGAKGITINNNTIETDTLAYFCSNPEFRYQGVISDVLSCNNTIVAFNESFVIDKDYPPILLNVMRIESSQCTPFLDVTFYPSVDFGAVNPYSVADVYKNLTVSSNMINLTYQIRGDTDWIGTYENFTISTLNFTVDKNLPYPTKEVTLELNVFKVIFHFLVNEFNNLLENLWRFSVPFVRAGNYNANVTMVVSNE